MVTVREQSQDCRVIDGTDRAELGVTQRDDRGGAGVMRVGLVGASRVEEPHPR
jgi:hypothetical protein